MDPLREALIKLWAQFSREPVSLVREGTDDWPLLHFYKRTHFYLTWWFKGDENKADELIKDRTNAPTDQ